MPNAMLKSELRKLALQQRNALTEEQLHSLSAKLLEQFKMLDFSEIKSIHIFLPIKSKREPDTFLFIDWIQHAHPEIEIVVPKTVFNSSTMAHFTFLDKADLATNHYHIPEPQTAKPFTGVPDMVIIPLLAFDEKGYRVGYGKGFYDRFLQQIDTQKVGLSFFDGVKAINDVHLNDIRLNKCITPNRIIEFT